MSRGCTGGFVPVDNLPNGKLTFLLLKRVQEPAQHSQPGGSCSFHCGSRKSFSDALRPLLAQGITALLTGVGSWLAWAPGRRADSGWMSKGAWKGEAPGLDISWFTPGEWLRAAWGFRGCLCHRRSVLTGPAVEPSLWCYLTP